MPYQAYLYIRSNGKSPVHEYIKSLNDPRAAAYIEAYINKLIAREGKLPFPHAKKVVGKIWELRTKLGNRVFYFIHTGQSIILLDGFTKKQDKIPSHILAKVLTEYHDFLVHGLKQLYN
ncbi:MAG: type II toxin-antitoxin system RelE/ParE family toxin [Patescibacteria group bacterium]